jgi:UDP-galactose transporter B1
MAVLQVVGQVSIYYVIVNFKQHIFPLISTTRKVLTVLLSIVIYGHNVNGLQWLSIFMVFGGLVY